MTDTPLHNFTFILGPEELLTDELTDELYGLLDDTLIGGRDHQAFIEYDRAAPTFAEAVIGALRELESNTDLRVLRVEPDDLVSLSAIAARVGRSVESIRLLAEGKRGPGGFPTPVAHVDAKTRLWDWGAVTEWWSANVGDAGPLAQGAQFLATLNDVLDARARQQHLAPSEKQAIAELAGAALAV
jgi:hypothetical protein